MKQQRSLRVLLAFALLVTGLVGLVPRQEVEASTAMSLWWTRDYFSDDTFLTQVGNRSHFCTTSSGWGDLSHWIAYDGGDCETGGSTGAGCCNDSNGNGQCDSWEPVVACGPRPQPGALEKK
jgi:hypothetical protein